MKKKTEVRLLIVNSQEESVTFILEPWGETFALDPGEQLSLVARGPEGGYPELDYEARTITYWGWSGSTVRVFKNDQEMGVVDVERTSIPENAYPNIKQPSWR
jgi:hypothetical protein